MMTLYSGITCPFSHRCRFVLFEKGMDFEIKDIDTFNKPEDLAVINPYNQVPVLVERDLILYESNIINDVTTLENQAATAKEQAKAREAIAQGLTMIAPAYAKNKYVLGDDFSMIDVALAPLLWRLEHYDIKLGKSAAPLLKSAERIFQRPAFAEALTPAEKAMRK